MLDIANVEGKQQNPRVQGFFFFPNAVPFSILQCNLCPIFYVCVYRRVKIFNAPISAAYLQRAAAFLDRTVPNRRKSQHLFLIIASTDFYCLSLYHNIILHETTKFTNC